MKPFDFAKARENMVENEVRTNDVTNWALIAAMREIPREKFVAEGDEKLAYVGHPIAIGKGRYLLDPRTFAKLVQAAQIGRDDLVLDIGCATGYSTAVLARLCDTVVGLERDNEFVSSATALLPTVGADNAAVIEGDLKAGAPGQGPFNVIVLEGAVSQVPQALFDQLADGGRLLAVEDRGVLGNAKLFERAGDVVSGRWIFDASVPVLPGFEREEAFSF